MKVSKRELEKLVLEIGHSKELEVIRKIQDYNENYLSNQTLNMYLDGLKNNYIYKYKRDVK